MPCLPACLPPLPACSGQRELTATREAVPRPGLQLLSLGTQNVLELGCFIGEMGRQNNTCPGPGAGPEPCRLSLHLQTPSCVSLSAPEITGAGAGHGQEGAVPAPGLSPSVPSFRPACSIVLGQAALHARVESWGALGRALSSSHHLVTWARPACKGPALRPAWVGLTWEPGPQAHIGVLADRLPCSLPGR